MEVDLDAFTKGALDKEDVASTVKRVCELVISKGLAAKQLVQVLEHLCDIVAGFEHQCLEDILQLIQFGQRNTKACPLKQSEQLGVKWQIRVCQSLRKLLLLPIANRIRDARSWGTLFEWALQKKDRELRFHALTAAVLLLDLDETEVTQAFAEFSQDEILAGFLPSLDSLHHTNDVNANVNADVNTDGSESFGRFESSLYGAILKKLEGLVDTPSTVQNVHKIMLALRSGGPVLLQGRSGAGKSLLVNTLAKLYGKHEDFVELQLDDQMDSKTLLGTYVCTDIPGEFRWQPGALTQAVQQGCWVFIEDIDRTPFEILAALIPLFESRRLLLPNRDQVIEAAPGFQIIATTRNNLAGIGLMSINLWTIVDVEPLSKVELGQVACKVFPSLSPPLVSLMLETFYSLAFPPKRSQTKLSGPEEIKMEEEEVDEVKSKHIHEDLPFQARRAIPGRAISERDFFKWLRRVVELVKLQTTDRLEHGVMITEKERQTVLVEAIDCFVSGMPSMENRTSIVRWMARVWRLSEDGLVQRLCSYKPNVSWEKGSGRVQVGRVVLKQSELIQSDSSGLANVASSGVSMRLLEQLAACVKLSEPVLLVGETGAGKTSMIQHLAKLLNKRLVVQNMHVQSDSTELLGGYKPVQLQHLVRPLYNRFVSLFVSLFSESANQKFLLAVQDSLEKCNWKKVSKAFLKACDMASTKLLKRKRSDNANGTSSSTSSSSPSGAKFQKTVGGRLESPTTSSSSSAVEDEDAQKQDDLAQAWTMFRVDAERFEGQRKRVETSFAFSFEEGALVKAIRQGDWVLLDEINLATGETLERLNSLLDDQQGTLSLTERGDLERVERHPEFRLFAAMNPATDFGKKDLPPALRSRFTELYVDEVEDPADLRLIVSCYMEDIADPPVQEVVDFYLKMREQAREQKILDGANQPPRYSLRTLCRSLSTARFLLTRGFGLRRALYEGLAMTFATLLNEISYKSVMKLVRKSFVPEVSSKALEMPPKCPGGKSGKGKFILCDKFWIEKGPRLLQDPTQVLPENRDEDKQAMLRQEEAEAEDIIKNFVITKTVSVNIQSLARAVAAHKYPILLQGPTSSGKTTMVAYLAAKTGHRCVRINNHEYTDLQEYMGSYVSDPKGNLVFREGILVEAVRKGYWIVLDELNLAPSEVLEALNRLLDDNRELFIPETQEVVKPHPSFMLFATQNPPGLYGGRKILSRAFRNRFLELHVGEIPTDELEIILNKRCRLAPPFCKVLVNVMSDLQMHRQQSRLFAGKEGFITPRDLLRWANRGPSTYEELAVEGFRLLGDRVRVEADKQVVKSVIEKQCKTELTDELLYGTAEQVFETTATLIAQNEGLAQQVKEAGIDRVVWTKAMNRVYGLVKRCLENKEPVLLVGETGCGKTTVCQLLALHNSQQLQILNCHQNTDTADILGSLRPIRGKAQLVTSIRKAAATLLDLDIDRVPASVDGVEQLLQAYWKEQSTPQNVETEQKAEETQDTEELKDMIRQHRALFEWQDGPLVSAMRKGDMFLLDELSLAEDAVLERLNSVLEPSRTLFLAEKGGDQVEEIKATDLFRILATMNPGGDYGKRELSPALRNRFTEIWIPPIHDRADLQLIVDQYFAQSLGRDSPLYIAQKENCTSYSKSLVEFFHWFNNGDAQGEHALVVLSLRDLISWADFILTALKRDTYPGWQAYIHGAGLVLLDGLGLGSGISFESCNQLRQKSYQTLLAHVPSDVRPILDADVLLSHAVHGKLPSAENMDVSVDVAKRVFGISPFFIDLGPSQDNLQETNAGSTYALDAPTTSMNLARVLRAMQLRRPILLEGSPGVGKTSLISSLAKRSGHRLVRINLSEQTDFADLIGSDIPAGTEEGTTGGAKFIWSDGVFLSALKAGDWVLLDELNLASQSVLEGLNACLDHRGTVYVPELDQYFHCPPSFRVFAAQNPLQQGGGRKGLPKSFLNRFTKVFVDSLTESDYEFIVSTVYPTIPNENIRQIVEFNSMIVRDIIETPRYARSGSPWEFNLRDIFRLCDLCVSSSQSSSTSASSSSAADGSDAKILEDLFENVALVYFDRLRTLDDRAKMCTAFNTCFSSVSKPWEQRRIELRLTPTHLIVGSVALKRNPTFSIQRTGGSLDGLTCTRRAASDEAQSAPFLPRTSLPILEHIAKCVKKQWPVLLVGGSGTGKTSMLRYLAQACNRTLHEFAVTSSTDSTELLGCFEQYDADRRTEAFLSRLVNLCDLLVSRCIVIAGQPRKKSLVRKLEATRSKLKRVSQDRTSGRGLSRPGQDLLLEQLSAERESLDIIKQGIESFRESGEDQLESFLIAEFRELEDVFVQRQEQLEEEHQGKKDNIGAFEWVDGTLVRAMEKGEWVVLDNANLCNPTVLDRLNPVLEIDGELMINECGMVNGKPRIIKPHKDFRVFLVMDPQYGEISRAMRNRCVEVALVERSVQELEENGDGVRLLQQLGMPEDVIPAMLRHPRVKTVRELVKWAREFKAHGSSVYNRFKQGALRDSFEIVFGTPTLAEEEELSLRTSLTPSAESTVSRVLPALGLTRHWVSESRLFSLLSDVAFFRSNHKGQRVPLHLAIQGASHNDLQLRLWLVGKSLDPAQAELLGQAVSHLRGSTLPGLLMDTTTTDQGVHLSDLPFQQQLVDPALLSRSWERQLLGQLWRLSLENQLQALRENNDRERVSSMSKNNKSLSEEKCSLLDASFLFNFGKVSREDVGLQVVGMFVDVLSAVSNFIQQSTFALVSALSSFSQDDARQALNDLVLVHQIRIRMYDLLKTVQVMESQGMQDDEGNEMDAEDAENDVIQNQARLDSHISTYSVLQSQCAKTAKAFLSKTQVFHKEIATSTDTMIQVFVQMDQGLESKTSRSLQVLGSFCSNEALLGSLERSVRLDRSLVSDDVCKLIWKKSGHPKAMASQALYELVEKIRKTVFASEPNDEATFANLVQHAHQSLLLSREDLHAISDALCTLEWMNHNVSTAKDATPEEVNQNVEIVSTAVGSLDAIQEWMSKLEAMIAMKQAGIRKTPELSAVVDSWSISNKIFSQSAESSDPVLVKASYSASWSWLVFSQLRPLVDHWFCRAMGSVLSGSLSGKTLSSVSELVASIALEGSSFSPLEIAPLQDLAWRLRGLPESETAFGFERNPFGSLLATYYASQWEGSFNLRDAIDADACGHLDTSLNKAVNKGDRVHVSGLETAEMWNNKLLFGSPRLSQDLNSVMVFRLVRGSGVGSDARQPRDRIVAPYGSLISIRDRAARLAQLDMCMSYLLFFESQAYRTIWSDQNQPGSWIAKADASIGQWTIQSTVGALLRARQVSSLSEVKDQFVQQTLANVKLDQVLDGKDLLLVALFRMHALLPRRAIDPSVEAQAKLGLATSIHQDAHLELELQNAADLESGSGFGPLEHGEQVVRSRMDKFADKMEKLKRKEIYRPHHGSTNMYAKFFSETVGFCNTFGAPDFVLKLVQSIEAGERSAVMEEQLWQEATEQLCQRLRHSFSGYSDLVEPFLVSVYQAKHGLRQLCASKFGKETSQASMIAESRRVLGSFPFSIVDVQGRVADSQLFALQSVLQAKRFLDKRAWTLALRAVFERALSFVRFKQQEWGVVYEENSALAAEDWSVVDSIMEAFAAQYVADKEERRRREAEEAEEVKYKTKHHVMEGAPSEEKDEASFRAMFPDFHAEFDKVREEAIQELNDEYDYGLDDDKKNEQNAEDGEDAEDEASRLVGVDRTIYVELVKGALEAIVGEDWSGKPRAKQGQEDLGEQLSRSFSLGYHAAGYFSEPFKSTGLLGAHLQALVLAIRDLQKRTVPMGTPTLLKKNASKQQQQVSETDLGGQEEGMMELEGEVEPLEIDLNRDPFIEEVVLLEAPLERLSQRLSILQQQWPENAVLLQLAKLTMRLRELPVSSPLMRALVGVETLLRVANDWETVAHSQVSIGEELKPLIRLVVRWRKLELQSWPFVLAQREKSTREDAILWFYDVYRIFGFDVEKVKHSKNSKEGQHKDLASELFATMDQFARTSTLGTFSTRLLLLRALRHLLESRLGSDSKQVEDSVQDDIQVKCNVLWHLEQYYQQWAADVQATLSREKAPISKKLKDHTKLARWDDRNYFALKESAEKSHRFLHKLTRDYDEILDQVAYATIEHVTDSRVKRQQGSATGPQVLVELDDVSSSIKAAKSVTIVPSSLGVELKTTATDEVEGIDTPKGYGKRLPSLARRMSKLCKRDIFKVVQGEFWNGGLEAASEINEAVMSRIQSLRTGKAPQSAKQRALVDLFRELRLHGLSHARPDNEMMFRDASNQGNAMFKLFSTQPVSDHDLTGSGVTPTAVTLWRRFDRDFFKSLAQLNRFRHTLLTGDWFQEVPLNILQKALSMSEHVFELLADQRVSIANLMSTQKELSNALKALENMSEAANPVSSGARDSAKRLTSLLEALRVSLGEFDQLQLGVGKAPSPVDLCQFLQRHGAKEMSLIAETRRGKECSPAALASVTGMVGETVNTIRTFVRLVARLADEQGPRYVTSEELKQVEEFATQGAVDLEERIWSIRTKCSWLPLDVSEELLTMCRRIKTTVGQFATSLQNGLNEMEEEQEEGDLFVLGRQALDDGVESMLVVFQQVRSLAMDAVSNASKKETAAAEDSGDDTSDTIAAHSNRLLQISKLLHGQRVEKLSSTVMQTLPSLLCKMRQENQASGDLVVKQLCGGLYDLVNTFHHLCLDFLAKKIQFCFNLGRLEFLLLRVFRTLASSGFCKPPEENDADGNASEDDFGEGEGTGMGEGKGREDVSDQIEDEEQLLGLKKDKEDMPEEKDEAGKEQQGQEQKEEEGLEMENDFEGEMFDMNDEKDQEGEEEEDDDKEELDREMGDLDREEENVVDEKLWDNEDEDDEDKDKENETFEKDAPMAGDNNEEDELRAKEDDEEEDKKEHGDDKKDKEEKKKDKSAQEEDEDERNEQNDNEEDERIDDMNDVEERHLDVPQHDDETGGDENGEEREEEDGEDLELPEDLQLEGNEDGEGEKEGEEEEEVDEGPSDGDDGQEKEDDEVSMEIDDDNDAPAEDAERQEQADKDDNEETSGDANAQAMEEHDDQGDEEDKVDDEEEEDERKANLPENVEGNDPDEQLDKAFGSDAPKAGQQDDQEEDDSKQREAVNARNEEEKAEEDHKKNDDSKGGSQGNSQDDTPDNPNQNWQRDDRPSEMDDTKEDSQHEQDRAPLTERMDRQKPNPWTNPGSASELWHRRLQMISEDERDQVEGQEESDEQQPDDQDKEESEEKDQLDSNEAKHDDTERIFDFSANKDESTDQVLAPSQQQQDENKETSEEMMEDEEEDNSEDPSEGKRKENPNLVQKEEEEDDNEQENEGEEEDEAEPARKRARHGDDSGRSKDPKMKSEETKSQDNEKNEDEAPKDGELEQVEKAEPVIKSEVEMLYDKGEMREDDEEEGMVDERAGAEMSSELEMDIVKEEVVEADFDKWNVLAGDTMESSQRLCEQLRLLLEPTLATKLRGDYRTGKRINMRRVIPYIASQFRKDKIWLRRTKPSKREYQVVLAIDDSKSMAPCRDLALNALAIMTKAMTKLEVGQVGVVSFGEQVRKIHELNRPFTDVAGAEAVAHFKFDQEKTVIEEGIGQILEMFEEGRADMSLHASSTGQKTEFRQLAFIVSDGRFDSAVRERVKRMIREALQRKMFIVLVIVETPGQESIMATRQVSFKKGKVKMSAYLDDYPFPLYVIIEEMESLPEVLSDALRQWFELLSTSD